MDEYDCRAPALDVVVEVGSRNRQPTLSVHVRIVVEPRLSAGVAQALPLVISKTRPVPCYVGDPRLLATELVERVAPRYLLNATA
jgi:hypothetical protein